MGSNAHGRISDLGFEVEKISGVLGFWTFGVLGFWGFGVLGLGVLGCWGIGLEFGV